MVNNPGLLQNLSHPPLQFERMCWMALAENRPSLSWPCSTNTHSFNCICVERQHGKERHHQVGTFSLLFLFKMLMSIFFQTSAVFVTRSLKVVGGRANCVCSPMLWCGESNHRKVCSAEYLWIKSANGGYMNVICKILLYLPTTNKLQRLSSEHCIRNQSQHRLCEAELSFGNISSTPLLSAVTWILPNITVGNGTLCLLRIFVELDPVLRELFAPTLLFENILTPVWL